MESAEEAVNNTYFSLIVIINCYVPKKCTALTKNNFQQITYRFLLGRTGERTSASEHLLLKGPVLEGVSPGEQPKQLKHKHQCTDELVNELIK